MARSDHLLRLLQDIDVWNEWRSAESAHAQGHVPNANLEVIDLSGANLSERDLSGANLSQVILADADLSGSILTKANLSSATLSRANLTAAKVDHACLSRALLDSTNLEWATFVKADLTGAILTEANLTDTSLSGATMFMVDLHRAHLSQADLSGANLQCAHLTQARLFNVDLTGADLAAAECAYTGFANVDLSVALNLDQIDHIGPSSISIDTLYRSRGHIPRKFLVGAGVQEILVDFLPSLTGSALSYYSCFISHSTVDKRFCERLQSDLRDRGVRVWFFPNEARGGRAVWGEIDRGIATYDKLLVVCSEASLTSGPVLREIERALQREDREKRDILFPIRIDDYLFKGWNHPRLDDVKSKVVVDFRGTGIRGTKKYEEALDRLIRDLQVE